MVTKPPNTKHENGDLFMVESEIPEARMASETIQDLNEARPENVPNTWEDAALEIGIHRPRSALLWCCPQCGHFNVSEHYDMTINRTLNLGSFKAKLTVGRKQACTSCGGFGFRLHSENGTRVIARIDASKHKQRRNLQAVAEELNAQIDEGGEPNEHDANAAWFRMNKLLKQGKGRKWWGLPFRRWRDTVMKRRCD